MERFTREKEPFGDGLNMFFQRNVEVDDIKYFTFGNPGSRETQPYRTRCYNEEDQLKMESVIEKNDGKYYRVGHHKSHASNAFFSSNFEESLIITIDGGGREEDMKDTAFTVWIGKGNKLKAVKTISTEELNIGSPWRAYTGKIFGLSDGYPYGNQAGTVMGMACVGDPKYVDDFLVAFRKGGGKRSSHVLKNIEKYKPIADRGEQDKFDIAASLQLATEIIT